MSRRLAFLAGPALLLAAVLPGATALHASAAPHSRPAATTALQDDNCAYFNDVVGNAIAIDFGSVFLDPADGGLPPGLAANAVLAQLQQLADSVHAATPPDGLEDYHADLLAAVDTFMDALKQAAAALNAGNNDQAHSIVSDASTTYRNTVIGLDDTYPDAKQQSDACNPSGSGH